MFGSSRKSLIPQAFSSAKRSSLNQTPVRGQQPPPRTGFSTARAARRRRSSFFKTLNQGVIKDPRNLSDRHVQQQLQRKIYQYLLDRNYAQINDKLVRCPTKAEFARMFEFIFQQLVPGFELKKLEDEMPRLLRCLGYPIQLKPSTMQTVGAAHTMPHLLGAISWLIDLAQMLVEISPQDLLLANEEGDGQRRSLTYGYIVRCYKNYYNNPGMGLNMENYAEENNLLRELAEENDDITQREYELDAQATMLNEEIAELHKDKGALDKLQSDTKTLEEDLKQLKAFRDGQREKLNDEQKQKDELEKELQQYGEMIANLRIQLSVKEKQLAAQTMSGEQARAMRVRKEELKTQIEQTDEERQKIDAENNAVLAVNFKEASQLRERYQAFVRTYEDASRTVNGVDESFFAVLEQHSPNEPNFSEFAVEIEDKLKELSDKVNGSIKNMEDNLAAKNHDTIELKQKKAFLVENLQNIQRQITKACHDFSLKREDWVAERQKAKLEVDVAQNELESLHAVRNGKLFAHEQLAEVRKELQNRQIETDDANLKIVNEVVLRFTVLLEQWYHLKKCDEQLRDCERLLRDAIDNMVDNGD